MPRIKQKAEAYAEEDFRREVRSRQGYYDLMSQQAQAEQADIPRPTLRKRLLEPEGMTVAEMRKLVQTLKPDPKVLLLLLGYTAKDIRSMKAEQEAADAS